MQRRTRSFLAGVLIGAALAGLACESAPLICTERWAQADSAAAEAASGAATVARGGMRGHVCTDASPRSRRTALQRR